MRKTRKMKRKDKTVFCYILLCLFVLKIKEPKISVLDLILSAKRLFTTVIKLLGKIQIEVFKVAETS